MELAECVEIRICGIVGFAILGGVELLEFISQVMTGFDCPIRPDCLVREFEFDKQKRLWINAYTAYHGGDERINYQLPGV